MTSISLRQMVWLVAALMLAACSGSPESTPSTLQPESTTESVAPSTTLTAAPPTTEPAVSTSTVQGPIEVTNSVDADGDPSTSLRAEFTITEPGWQPLVGTYKSGPGGYVAVKFLAVTQVASAACDSTVWIPVGETAEDLASALAEIEDFLTKEALNTVSAYGYDGYHLVLEAPDREEFSGCDDGYFDGYEGPTFSRYYQGPHQVVEFWVLDVEGTPLLIEATWFPNSPAEDVAQLQAILDSIVIRP